MPKAQGIEPGRLAQPVDPSDGSLTPDVRTAILEAQDGWLDNPSIELVLKDFRRSNLPVNTVPPIRPPRQTKYGFDGVRICAGGSIFIFDKAECRFFRRDGYDWKKKPDGKTIGETHEKLKVNNREALNCYYAHPTSASNPRRRSYWLLPEQDSLVLVHYLVASGSRSKRRERQVELSDESEEQNEQEEVSHRVIATRSKVKQEATAVKLEQTEEPTRDIDTRTEMSGENSVTTESSKNVPEVSDGVGLDEFAMSLDSLGPLASLDSFLPHSCSVEGSAELEGTHELGSLTSLELPLEKLAGHFPQAMKHAGRPWGDMTLRIVNSNVPPESTIPKPHITEGPLHDQRQTHAMALDDQQWNTQAAQHSQGFSGGHMETSDMKPEAEAGPDLGIFGYSTPSEPISWNQLNIEGSESGVYQRPRMNPRLAEFTAARLRSGTPYFPNFNRTLGPMTPSPSHQAMPYGRNSIHGHPTLPSVDSHEFDLDNSGGFQLRPRLADPMQSPFGIPMSGGSFMEPSQDVSNSARSARTSFHPALMSAPLSEIHFPSFENGMAGNLGQRSTSANLPPILGNTPIHHSQNLQQGSASIQGTLHDVGGSKALRRRSISDSIFSGSPTFSPTGRIVANRALSLEKEVALLDQEIRHAGDPTLLSEDRMSGLRKRAQELQIAADVLAQRRTRSTQLASQDNVSGDAVGQNTSLQGLGRVSGDDSSAWAEGPGGMPAPFQLLERTPDWDFSAGGAKVMIACHVNPRYSSQQSFPPLSIAFGGREVSAEIVRPGVLVCLAPPHHPASVDLCITVGDGLPQSNIFSFTYRPNPGGQYDPLSRSLLTLGDRDAQLELIKMLQGSSQPESQIGNGIEKRHSHQASATNSGSVQQHSAGTENYGQDSGNEVNDPMHDVTAEDTFQAKEALLSGMLVTKLHGLADEAERGGQANFRSQNHADLQGKPGMLHLAASLGLDNAIGRLVSIGHSVSHKDKSGCIALHGAALKGRLRCVALLVALSSDCQSVNCDGDSPADLAHRRGHLGIAGFLAELQLKQALNAMSMEPSTSTPTMSQPGSPHRKRTRTPELASLKSSAASAKSHLPGVSNGLCNGTTTEKQSSSLRPGSPEVEVLLQSARESAWHLEHALVKNEAKMKHLGEKQQATNRGSLEALERMKEREDMWLDLYQESSKPDQPKRSSLEILQLGSQICNIQQTLQTVIQPNGHTHHGTDWETQQGLADRINSATSMYGPSLTSEKEQRRGSNFSATKGTNAVHWKVLRYIEEMAEDGLALADYEVICKAHSEFAHDAAKQSGFKFACLDSIKICE